MLKLMVNLWHLLDIEEGSSSSDIRDIAPVDEIQERLEDELQLCGGELKFGGGTSITYGAEDSEAVTSAASSWNSTIKKTLDNAIQAYLQVCSTPHAPVLDTPETYALYRASRAADDNFHPYSDCGILTENDSGFLYFHTVMNEELLADILENPAHYAYITMAVY